MIQAQGRNTVLGAETAIQHNTDVVKYEWILRVMYAVKLTFLCFSSPVLL